MDYTSPEFIAGAAGALVTVAREIYSQHSKHKAKKAQSGVLNVLHAHSEMTGICKDLVRNTRFNRAVLLKCHNGGAVPQIGKTLYSTAYVEDYEPPLGSAIKSWTRQQLDAGYIHLLCNLAHRKTVKFSAESCESPILKNLYKSQGVKWSSVSEVLVKESAYWYLSLNATEDFSLLPEELNEIREANNRLHQILHKVVD